MFINSYWVITNYDDSNNTWQGQLVVIGNNNELGRVPLILHARHTPPMDQLIGSMVTSKQDIERGVTHDNGKVEIWVDRLEVI